jgi:hypothetical protein
MGLRDVPITIYFPGSIPPFMNGLNLSRLLSNQFHEMCEEFMGNDPSVEFGRNPLGCPESYI